MAYRGGAETGIDISLLSPLETSLKPYLSEQREKKLRLVSYL